MDNNIIMQIYDRKNKISNEDMIDEYIINKIKLEKALKDEKEFFYSLYKKGFARRSNGNLVWHSESSGLTYDTSMSYNKYIFNNGENGLFYWIAHVLSLIQ